MAPHMPMADVARLVDEHGTRLWRLIAACDGRAAAPTGSPSPRRWDGRDVESPGPRLHHALRRSRPQQAPLRHAGPRCEYGGALPRGFVPYGGRSEQLAEVCCDMAPPYLKDLTKAFPGVPITFDRFHLVQLVNQAAIARGEPNAANGPTCARRCRGDATRSCATRTRSATNSSGWRLSCSAVTRLRPAGVPSQARLPGGVHPAAACGGRLSATLVSVGSRQRPA